MKRVAIKSFRVKAWVLGSTKHSPPFLRSRAMVRDLKIGNSSFIFLIQAESATS